MAEPIRLIFEKPGLYTSVQGTGRSGQQEFGVPVGGALDREAARTANRLVGNPEDAPVLEITLIGPEIRIAGSGQIALTGADLSAQLNGKTLPRYQTVEVEDGAVITFGKPESGSRPYFAFGGEYWLDQAMDIDMVGAFIPGKRIVKGAVLSIHPNDHQELLHASPPDFPSEITVKVMPGPEMGLFSETTLNHFFGTAHRLSPDCNRMGCRLETQLLDYHTPLELISSGVVPGTVQITASGQPIVLLADAQTTGGYPRMVNLLSSELDRVAQLKPGDQIRFQLA